VDRKGTIIGTVTDVNGVRAVPRGAAWRSCSITRSAFQCAMRRAWR